MGSEMCIRDSTLNGDPNVAALQRYTIKLYKELEELTGVDCGIHLTGELMLADDEDRLDWLKWPMPEAGT